MDLTLDFFVNKGAELSKEDIDKAIEKLKEVFKPAGITFSPGTVTPLDNPQLPKDPLNAGKDKSTAEQDKCAKEAEAEAKKLKKPGHIIVKVVHNFRDPDKPEGNSSTVNGITINGTIVIASPDSIEMNKQGAETFGHALAHEVGHSLGLKHKLLPSDKDIKNQTNGEYADPNLMAPDADERNKCNDLTKDQVEELKKAAAALIEKKKGKDEKKDEKKDETKSDKTKSGQKEGVDEKK